MEGTNLLRRAAEMTDEDLGRHILPPVQEGQKVLGTLSPELLKLNVLATDLERSRAEAKRSLATKALEHITAHLGSEDPNCETYQAEMEELASKTPQLEQDFFTTLYMLERLIPTEIPAAKGREVDLREGGVLVDMGPIRKNQGPFDAIERLMGIR